MVLNKKMTFLHQRLPMTKFLLVFIGGGLGSLCRFGIAEFLSENKATFPYATFWANFISCFILGILLSLSLKSNLSPQLKFLFSVGFCGGFSTFSTFTGEIFLLSQNGQYSTALFYIFTSLLVCLISLYLGFRFTQMF